MKILSKKKCDEILMRILANEVIQTKCGLRDIEAETKATENRAMIAFMVGGVKGMHKILDTAWNYMPDSREQKMKMNKVSDIHDTSAIHINDEEPRTLETVPLDWEDWIINDKNYQ